MLGVILESLPKMNLNIQELVCLQGDLALPDLTFTYRQVLITSCPLSHLSEIDLIVSF